MPRPVDSPEFYQFLKDSCESMFVGLDVSNMIHMTSACPREFEGCRIGEIRQKAKEIKNTKMDEKEAHVFLVDSSGRRWEKVDDDFIVGPSCHQILFILNA